MQLFSNPKKLEEAPSDFDSLGYSSELKYVLSRINRLVTKNSKSIIAYIGPFGVGKSTILLRAEKKTKDYKWVTFELWRHSNRNELWDAFVIKVWTEVTGLKELEIANELDGKKITKENKCKLIKIFLIGLAISILVSALIFCLYPVLPEQLGNFIKAYLKYSFPISAALITALIAQQLLSGSDILPSPAKRVFQLEDMLERAIFKLEEDKKPLVIVVEDVDRSVEEGHVFLETLSYFLHSKADILPVPVVVIAPQNSEGFDRYEPHMNKGLERSLKIYDEKIYFDSVITDESIVKLFTSLRVAPKYKDILIKSTQIIINKHRKSISIRLLKNALREVNQFADMNPTANPCVSLAIILSRYVSINNDIGAKYLAISRLIAKNSETRSRTRILEFYYAIAVGLNKLNEAEIAKSFKISFTDEISESTITSLPDMSGTNYTLMIELPTFYKKLIT